MQMQELGHVLWIGGPPGSGKTAVASRLARRYGLRLYSSDTRTWQHRDRALRAGNAAARRWEAMTPEERWQLGSAELRAEGDADDVACEFLCECGDPACDASVRLRVGELAAATVLAPGHRW